LTVTKLKEAGHERDKNVSTCRRLIRNLLIKSFLYGIIFISVKVLKNEERGFMQVRTSCEKLIQDMSFSLPDRCSVKDLVSAGIFKSHPAAYNARKVNEGPPYIKAMGRVIYPKDGVIEWLNMNRHETLSKEA